jgi:activating signal cointegrator 1
MKAISLWQPWASLWGCGRKQYETRHWATNYRGAIAVHAAKRICTDIDDELREILEDEFGGHWAIELPRGALIATANLVRCYPTGSLLDLGVLNKEELAQGDFTIGRFGWKTENMRELPQPIPYIGHQGIFDVPNELFGLPPISTAQGSLL